MEPSAIRTDKGDLNRWIRKTNAILREAKQKIAALIGWLKDVKAELAKPQPPMLNDLLALHCANRNKGAYSNKAKNANLQRYAEAFSFLQSKNLYTVDDLETTLHAMQDKTDTLKKPASANQTRIKELDGLLRMVDYYKSGKPAADKLKSIRFEKSRQKYKAEHDDELRTFFMAERKLKPYFKDGKLPITAWRKERSSWSRDTRTPRRSFRRFMPTQKSSGQFITTSTRCSMSRSARTPRRGRKNRKLNTTEGVAY